MLLNKSKTEIEASILPFQLSAQLKKKKTALFTTRRKGGGNGDSEYIMGTLNKETPAEALAAAHTPPPPHPSVLLVLSTLPPGFQSRFQNKPRNMERHQLSFGREGNLKQGNSITGENLRFRICIKSEEGRRLPVQLSPLACNVNATHTPPRRLPKEEQISLNCKPHAAHGKGSLV